MCITSSEHSLMTFGSTILLSLSPILLRLPLLFSRVRETTFPAVYGRRGASYLNDARSGIRSSCFFSFRNA